MDHAPLRLFQVGVDPRVDVPHPTAYRFFDTHLGVATRFLICVQMGLLVRLDVVTSPERFVAKPAAVLLGSRFENSDAMCLLLVAMGIRSVVARQVLLTVKSDLTQIAYVRLFRARFDDL